MLPRLKMLSDYISRPGKETRVQMLGWETGLPDMRKLYIRWLLRIQSLKRYLVLIE